MEVKNLAINENNEKRISLINKINNLYVQKFLSYQETLDLKILMESIFTFAEKNRMNLNYLINLLTTLTGGKEL